MGWDKMCVTLIKFPNKFFCYLIQSRTLFFLALVSIISSFRSLFIPLHGDEITYVHIATNLLDYGQYSLNEKASTVTPILPIIIAGFSKLTNLEIGIICSRFLQIIFALVGTLFVYKTIYKIIGKRSVTLAIVVLTVVNNIFIVSIGVMYPDSILFCFLWVLLYYLSEDVTNIKTWIPILISMVLLVMTRYLFAVMGLPVLFAFFRYLKSKKNNNFIHFSKLAFLIVIALIPLILWFIYVGSIETQQTNGISYFTRFKNHGIWYNLQAGIGIIKSDNVDKINGLPAFASLFIPITGLRSWLLSIPLILITFYGYFKNKSNETNRILLTMLLIMIGLVFAGTGFSRYWLPLLPAYILGFYLSVKQFKMPDKWFQLAVVCLSIIYVINELRLDHLVYQRF